MKDLIKQILLEGRVDDAQQYFEDAVGSWPVAEFQNPAGVGAGTNVEGVLDHFVQNDPSGNNKYLMWMVKMYLNPEERGTSPNDISSLVQRFHNNVDRLTPAIIADMGYYSGSNLVLSPRNIDSYTAIATLERVLDEIESIQTKKVRETEAKSGVDKLYEDDRWLLVKPNTYEGSCYYGSSTKWCTSSKDAPQHFASYSKEGNLFYIIDKSHELGDYWKIALHKKFTDGSEEWYDRADNLLSDETENAIYSMLPQPLISAFVGAHEDYEEPEPERFTYAEFAEQLKNFVNAMGKPMQLKTQSGIWNLNISDDEWRWTGDDPRLEVIATPFPDGEPILHITIATDGAFVSNEDSLALVDRIERTLGIDDLSNPALRPEYYLQKDPTGYHYDSVARNLKLFLSQIYYPQVRQVLDREEIRDFVGMTYKTWSPNSWVSSYAFKYPPKMGSMTQRFVDYVKQNPGKTSNEFYNDVLGYNRPRGHNNMFFASIKDAGIVKMERRGRQFVYSLGPNHQDWVDGKLLKI